MTATTIKDSKMMNHTTGMMTVVLGLVATAAVGVDTGAATMTSCNREGDFRAARLP